MGKFQDRMQEIAEQVDNVASFLGGTDDDRWIQASDIAKWFASISADLQSAMLDEDIYSERTRAGFPQRPGVDIIDEQLVALEFHNVRIHSIRFTHPGLTGRDGGPANISLARQPRYAVEVYDGIADQTESVLHERVQAGAGDGQGDGDDGGDGTDGD